MKRLALATVLLAACSGATSEPGPVQTFPDLGADHLTAEAVAAYLAGDESVVTYNSNPPTSGAHANAWALCGVYRQVIPDPFQVHSLEHGAVIVAYRSDIPGDVRDEIENLARELATHIVVAPDDDLTPAMALTAWGRLQTADDFDVEAFRSFWAEAAATGPERISCPFEVDEATGESVDFNLLASA